MLSPDGERVALAKGLKARGNVENWLGLVEENMMVTLRRLLKASIQDFEVSDKNDWVVRLVPCIVNNYLRKALLIELI